MPTLVVCPLSSLETTIQSHNIKRVVSLISPIQKVVRPSGIASKDHLPLHFNDITEEREGYVSPNSSHIAELLSFMENNSETESILLHCWFGISRSPAAAFILACALNPAKSEEHHAKQLRSCAPTATPNALMVSHADKLLQRDGRMSKAIAGIGRGAEASCGTSFIYPVY
ncbi:tyrosine phosphatase family protein [Flexibacterium corallicola]|uniref:tyrosine phosphatase family protein n=1 Tax=Flexibacterium corallicola TaxID=3037259 RepID=UPI00286EC315|nr:protein tyrosine phosphatase [Pseudovibrio sp. M1P-2-3]